MSGKMVATQVGDGIINVQCFLNGTPLSFEVKRGVSTDSIYYSDWWMATEFLGRNDEDTRYNFSVDMIKKFGLTADILKEALRESRGSLQPELAGKRPDVLSVKWVEWKMTHGRMGKEAATNIGAKLLAKRLTGYPGKQITFRRVPENGLGVCVTSVGYEPTIFDPGYPHRISDAWVEWLVLQYAYILKKDSAVVKDAFQQDARERYFGKVFGFDSLDDNGIMKHLERYRIKSNKSDWQIMEIEDTLMKVSMNWGTY